MILLSSPVFWKAAFLKIKCLKEMCNFVLTSKDVSMRTIDDEEFDVVIPIIHPFGMIIIRHEPDKYFQLFHAFT